MTYGNCIIKILVFHFFCWKYVTLNILIETYPPSFEIICISKKARKKHFCYLPHSGVGDCVSTGIDTIRICGTESCIYYCKEKRAMNVLDQTIFHAKMKKVQSRKVYLLSWFRKSIEISKHFMLLIQYDRNKRNENGQSHILSGRPDSIVHECTNEDKDWRYAYHRIVVLPISTHNLDIFILDILFIA